jgi:predicted Zn-dependent protease
MKAELDRSLRTLKSQPEEPYFLSYEITDDQVLNVSGAFGKLLTSEQGTNRQLDIDLRVGDPHLDNTHMMRETGGAQSPSTLYVPIEADPDALRAILWYYTDLKYKQATEQLTKVKIDAQVKVEEEDKSDDFSREPVAKFFAKPLTMSVDRHAWEEKVRKYTAPFASYGNIYGATATLILDIETRWYVSSEGSETVVSLPFYHLYLSAFTKADDGMELPRYESFFAFEPEGLPSDDAVLATVAQMIKDLQALRAAPMVDPYAGPAILSGRASGVFFHEIFGHRIEGHRQKGEQEGQTFTKKVGEKVLPDNFSVISDPTERKLGPADLAGYYVYDNQGVKGQPVTVVHHGVFKNFLMSRSPIEGFPHSNGHGRKQQGYFPVGRQSNLIVQVDHPVSRAQLKQMLIEEVKKENKPWGLYFDDIQGGFTLTGRTTPNAFTVLPVMVYRVYADGREELVRGVDLIGTPLTTFSKIVAGDNEMATFNGICGAESGSIEVSASSPAVLVSQIEVQKKQKSQERPPVLPAPVGQ